MTFVDILQLYKNNINDTRIKATANTIVCN